MIGIFDSGSGGITVLRAIREKMSDADIVYFGDTANAPYGNKSREELALLTANGFSKLKELGATHFVSACNSVSASVTEELLAPLGIPFSNVIEMSRPTIASFKNHPESKILVVATRATIDSRMYQDGFGTIGIGVQTVPIPALAGAIENGAPSPILRSIIVEALETASSSSFDTVLLGCTHFPLISDLFTETLLKMNVRAAIVDPAYFVAEAAASVFPKEGSGTLQIYVSRQTPHIAERIKVFFPSISSAMNAA